MDGVEIHNPYRLFGLTSAFNPETVERFELTAGGFGAKYGDRLSSLLDRGEPGRRRATAASRGSSALSLTDANVIAEGTLPEARAGSWLADRRGARTTTSWPSASSTRTCPRSTTCRASVRWERGPRALAVASSGLRSREATDATFDDDETQERAAPSSPARATTSPPAASTRRSARSLTSDTVARLVREHRRCSTWTRCFQNTAGAPTLPATTRLRPGRRRSSTARSPVRDLSLRQSVAWPAGRHTARGRLRAARLDTARRASHHRRPQPDGGQRLERRRAAPACRTSLDSSRPRPAAAPGCRTASQVTARPDARARPAPRLERREPARDALAAPGRDAPPRRRHAAARGRRPVHPEPRLREARPVRLLHRPHGRAALDLDNERAVHALLGLERDLAPGLPLRVEGVLQALRPA